MLVKWSKCDLNKVHFLPVTATFVFRIKLMEFFELKEGRSRDF